MLKWFRNISLYQQLIIPLIVIGGLGFFATIYSALELEKSVSALGTLTVDGDKNLRALEELNSSISYYRALSVRHVASDSPFAMTELGVELNYTEENIRTYLASIPFQPMSNRAGTLPPTQQLTDAVNNYLEESTRIIFLSADEQKELAFSKMSEIENDIIPELNSLLADIKRFEIERLSTMRLQLTSAAQQNLMLTISIGLIGGVIALMITFFIIRRITSRLSSLLDWSLQAASGNLSADLTTDSTDEVGKLTESMQVMADNIISAHHDLDEAKQHAEREADERRIYANSFEKSGEAMLITDRHNRIIDANAAFQEQTGYQLSEILGKDPKILASDQTTLKTYDEMWQALRTKSFWQGELWDRKKDGSVYPKWISISAIRDKQGEVLFYIASFSDISERKDAEARIEHLAHHDILTGLNNRFSLENLLEQAIHNAERHKTQLAVLFMDLDRFKNINDTLGHFAGDKLLIAVAQRLTANVRDSDIVARLGGDEFVVVLNELKDSSFAAVTAQKIIKSIGQPFDIDEQQLATSPSIGISVYPIDGSNVEALLRSADAAMYHAKESGRNTYHYFDESLFLAANERIAIERDLRAAINTEQLFLNFQPIVQASDLQVVSLEALCRWQHPDRGLISPELFIPIAENSGIIYELGKWVINEVCLQIKQWQANGLQDFKTSINLSARQLQSDSLLDDLSEILYRHQLGGSCLNFEITETAAMRDPEQAIKKLEAIRALGIDLTIDDFGTGYSSLAYLKRFPIQKLKIDKAFVRDIEHDPNDAAICIATISLAHSLGIQIIGEGVETEAQQDFLMEHGSDYLQGFYFSKPMSAADTADFLITRQKQQDSLLNMKW